MATKRGFAKFMTWIGVAAALISFGTAVYEILHAQGELRERQRIVTEQIASGKTERVAGDYPTAWQSLNKASDVAQTDGLFAKLFGGLSDERQLIRSAQEDLAMEWIRKGRLTEGQSFAELPDRLVNTLANGVNTSTGTRQADLLAHLGWAYFLKYRSGDQNLHPEEAYRRAVAIDANNPYANVFWGHWILWQQGSMSSAQQHFAAALTTERERTVVREFQLAALANAHTDAAQTEWLRVIEQMHEQGEPIDAGTLRDLYSRYYFALNDTTQRAQLLDALAYDKQLALERMLLNSGELETSQKLVVRSLIAMTLAAASRRDEALVAWRALLNDTGAEQGSTIAMRARTEIKRLTGGASR